MRMSRTIQVFGLIAVLAGVALWSARTGALLGVVERTRPVESNEDHRAQATAVLTTSGRASIYSGDLSGARDRATRAALVRALERYGGIDIDAATLVVDGDLRRRELHARTRGYVESYRVTGEQVLNTEIAVEAVVRVASSPSEASLRHMMAASRSVLVVREEQGTAGSDPDILAPLLASSFEGGWLSSTGLEAIEVPVTGAWEDADVDTAQELGARYLADLVVIASGQVDEIAAGSVGYDLDTRVLRPVASATGTLVVISTDTGTIVTSTYFDDVRGSDATDPARAASSALRRLGVQMRDHLTATLSEHLAEAGHRFWIVVEGHLSGLDRARAQRLLESLRWVESAELEDALAGETTFRLSSRESVSYVIDELEQATELEVSKLDGRSRTVTVKLR